MSFNRPNIGDLIIDSNDVKIDTTLYNAGAVAPSVLLYNDFGDVIPWYATVLGPSNTIGQKYKLPVPVPGTYLNVAKWSNMTPALVHTMNIKYQIFQKCVINQSVDGTIVSNNAQVTKAVNTNVVFNGQNSRGTELSYELFVKKSDNNSGWVNAVLGVDYTVISSTGLIKTLQFLSTTNFQVRIQASGYNSNNNPFDPITDSVNNARTKVTSNVDTMTLVVVTNSSTTDPVITTDFKVTFPKIEALITPVIDLGSNPEKSYTHTIVNVKPNVLYNTGSMFHGLLPIVMSPSQWQDKLENETNITLKVLGSDGSDAITPINNVDWLGTDLILPLADEYKIIYITTLK